MPTTLYLEPSGHPNLRLCDPLVPCPPLGGYDPAVMDWSSAFTAQVDQDDDTESDFTRWLDDANQWEVVIPPEPQPPNRDGGDGGDWRRGRPILMYRPKAVRQLEEAKEELESIRPNGRVSNNKKKVKAALAIVKAIDPPPSYAENIAAIETALKTVSRETAKHQGMQTALISVMTQMEMVMAEITAEKAAQRKRNMEKLLWLI